MFVESVKEDLLRMKDTLRTDYINFYNDGTTSKDNGEFVLSSTNDSLNHFCSGIDNFLKDGTKAMSLTYIDFDELNFIFRFGVIYGKNNKTTLSNINKQTGRLISDFYILFGETTYINMGILGILATCFVIVIGGDLNGATICGIFTIIGFGCFGKNIKNTIPIVIGATIAAIFNINDVTSPSLLLSILFSTTLAPICGKFGWKYGVLAGIIHVNIVTNIGYLHGGLNLYNNGLAGGFVAMILIPLITTFKKEI